MGLVTFKVRKSIWLKNICHRICLDCIYCKGPFMFSLGYLQFFMIALEKQNLSWFPRIRRVHYLTFCSDAWQIDWIIDHTKDLGQVWEKYLDSFLIGAWDGVCCNTQIRFKVRFVLIAFIFSYTGLGLNPSFRFGSQWGSFNLDMGLPIWSLNLDTIWVQLFVLVQFLV